MSWRVGVIVVPMMWIYFQIKRLSKCALKRVACPTLVLCGRQDALTPVALHEEIAAGIRGAKLVVERSGHLSPLEQPDVVSAAVRRWLADRAGSKHRRAWHEGTGRLHYQPLPDRRMIPSGSRNFASLPCGLQQNPKSRSNCPTRTEKL